MSSVLVLDANHRCALAATRALGARGLDVYVGDASRRSLTGCSRHAREHLSYPSPYERPEAFVRTIRELCETHRIDVLFPMSEVTTWLTLRHRGELGDVRLPFAPWETVERLSDKTRLMELAFELGLPVPRTEVVHDADELRGLSSRWRFPVVLKPHRSRIWSGGRWIHAEVQYANSASEAEALVESHEAFQHPFLVQEYVRGEGRGVFTLYDRSRPLVFFAHRRLREKPPSGGVSVLCESVAVPESLEAMTRRLLDAVGWHGVAMVEFKIDRTGAPFVMEVNGRFWGSLQLAVDAGVDFPWLLYQLAMGEPPDVAPEFRVGVRSRWLLGDLAHLYRLMSGYRGPSAPFLRRCRDAMKVLDFFDRDTRYDVNRWNDLRPFVFELGRLLPGSSGRANGSLLSRRRSRPSGFIGRGTPGS